MMQTGTVVSYGVEKGWSFVRSDGCNGKDLFAHMSELRNCRGTDLVPGTHVTFDRRFNKRRLKYRAAEVRLID
ncbi:cold-shock protein [Bradyrhizobium sp. Pa8]|uniref:cold-shock protein n=1 Tax=Bradyrhizobium sp. Pa8 TaxID=3386552 RepID=UPI00403FA027